MSFVPILSLITSELSAILIFSSCYRTSILEEFSPYSDWKRFLQKIATAVAQRQYSCNIPLL